METDALELTLSAMTLAQIITLIVAFYALGTFFFGPAKPPSCLWALLRSIGRIVTLILALSTGVFLQLARESLIDNTPLAYHSANPLSASVLPPAGREELLGGRCFNFTSPALDHYQVLGLARNAPLDTVQPAYRALIRACHPDKLKGVDSEAASENYERLRGAYEVLKDDASRCEYDCDQLVGLFQWTPAVMKHCDECRQRKHWRRVKDGAREEPWAEAASVLRESRAKAPRSAAAKKKTRTAAATKETQTAAPKKETQTAAANKTTKTAAAKKETQTFATGTKEEQKPTTTQPAATQEPTVAQTPTAHQDHEWDDAADYWDDYEDEVEEAPYYRPQQHKSVSTFVRARAAAGEIVLVLKKYALTALVKTRDGLKRFSNTVAGRKISSALMKARSCIENRFYGTALDKYVSYATGKMRVPVKRFLGSPLGARVMVLLMKGVIPALDDLVKFWQ